MCSNNCFVALTALLLNVPLIVADGCRISLTSMPPSEPLLLTAPASLSTTSLANYQLFKPTAETTIIKVGTKLRLFCSGQNNAIQLLEQPTLDLVCGSGNVLQDANGEQYMLNELGCKFIPTSDLNLTSQKCGADESGYIYQAGFSIRAQNFATVFSICYDNITESTLFTHNTINGAAINFSISESTRRAFRANGMKFTTTATNNFYTLTNQIERFENYFGEQQTYINSRMYMARGHLTPDADFIFGYEQLATYFYVNVAPEFQSINAGNWIRVENLARSLAAKIGDELEIYNGYIGQLQLTHPQTAALVNIYLENTKQIKAPQYYFKVIKHANTDAAIVMITLNNPFAIKPKREEFCSNVCVKAGVHTDFFNDASRGYTFCCELSEFKKHFGNLPKELSASKLLHASHKVGNNVSNQQQDEQDNAVPSTSGCLITMPEDILSPEPVYILSTMQNHIPRLLKPTGQFTTIPIGSNLTLFCAGAGNTLSTLKQQTLVLTCQQDNTFYNFEKLHTFKLNELNCSRLPTPELLLTSKRCAANKGYIFQPGYFLGKHFVDAFSICYDNKTEQTLYTRNVINGATQSFKINQLSRRAFRADGMHLTTKAANNIYTIGNQLARFKKFFGLQQKYIDNTMFLARGHMTPDADFIFGYEQLATYYYANVAPEFQSINAANWIRVENIARSLATEFQSDLLTFTSTLGLLQLPATSGKKLIDIYLDDEQHIEVPKWFYKILMHPELEADIVLVTLNNPFAKSEDIVEFCSNVCEEYGISSPHFSDISRGYTFCCTLEDFRNAVKDLPAFDLPNDWEF